MPNFTKLAIKETFLRLLEERPYSQITVTDLVKECGINRNSFYYHYTDLPALVEEIISDEIGRFLKEPRSFDSLEESLSAATAYLREHKRAMYHLYGSVNRDIFERYLMKNCAYVASSYVHSLLPESGLSEEDLRIIIDFNKYLCFGAVIEWLESGLQKDIEADFRRLCELMIYPSMERNGLLPPAPPDRQTGPDA